MFPVSQVPYWHRMACALRTINNRAATPPRSWTLQLIKGGRFAGRQCRNWRSRWRMGWRQRSTWWAWIKRRECWAPSLACFACSCCMVIHTGHSRWTKRFVMIMASCLAYDAPLQAALVAISACDIVVRAGTLIPLSITAFICIRGWRYRWGER